MENEQFNYVAIWASTRIATLEAQLAELAAENERMKLINANLMGDDEGTPRYTTKRLKQEIAKAMESLSRTDAVKVTEATHRHKKRGTDYVFIGFGKIQARNWYEERGPNIVTDLWHVDMSEVAIYRSVDDGSLWVRPREEFEDGRFNALKAAMEAEQ